MNRSLLIGMIGLAGILMGACRNDSGISGSMDHEGKLYIPWDTQYEVDSRGGSVLVPVTCEGAWTAVANDGWVRIINPEGIGTDTLRLYIDQNGTGRDRTADIRVCLGTDTEKGYSVTLDQPTSSVLFVANGIANGAGYSYDISKDYCKGVSFAIFDIDYLDSIQHRVGQYFVMDDWTPYSEDQYVQGESEKSLSNQLSAQGTIDLNALIAKASVEGSVKLCTAETQNFMYAVMRTKRIVYMRDLQFSNIIQYYMETGDSCVFAMGFFNDWKRLQVYETDLKSPPAYMVNEFLDKWGLGFVTRSYMGGCVDYRIAVDKSILSQELTVKVAANLAVMGGVLNADGSFGWMERYEKMQGHYSLDIEISGGDVQSISSIVFGESITMPDLKKWMDSVSFSEDGNNTDTAVLVDMKVASMANLFTGQVREKVKQIIDNRTGL